MTLEFGVEWCRRCGRHQALTAYRGICPVCDPDGSQTAAVRSRADAALASIDRVLSPTETITPPSSYPLVDVASSSTTHEVKKVGTVKVVSPEIWHGDKQVLVERYLMPELERYMRQEGLWPLAESSAVQVLGSLFAPYRVPAPRRWWHRLVSPAWKPAPLILGSHHEEDGEAAASAPGLTGYKIGATCRAVDLPPERHPSPEFWRRGTFRVPQFTSPARYWGAE